MRTSRSQCCVGVGCGLTVNSFLKRIGAGAFEYDFGALDGADNPLAKSYQNLMYGYLSSPPVVQGSRSANRPPRSLVLRRSGIHPDYSFSSCPSRDSSQD